MEYNKYCWSVYDSKGDKVTKEILKGAYESATDLFGIVIPNGLVVSVEHDLNHDFQDACFYPNGPIATVTVQGTPVSIYLDNDGEMNATYFDSQTGEETVLRNHMDLRNCFPNGEKDLDKLDNELTWDMNPWFDLYQAPFDESKDYIQHLDCVSHMINDGLRRAVAAAVEWLPYAHLFNPDCSENVLLDAVLSFDMKARDAALANPNCPESVRISAVLADSK